MPNLLRLVCFCLVALGAVPAFAQSPSPVNCTATSNRQEVVSSDDHHFLGNASWICDDGTEVYAEEIWFYGEENRTVATGNVVFSQDTTHIAAARAEFDTRTRMGTFYDAWGFASLGSESPGAPPAPGALASEASDVFFFGETVERIGDQRFRITKGGFTTCVQPTPRWELHANTVDLHIDHYTMLRGVVFRVKNVPLLYVPIIYYPTNEEDRATGILLPTYGSSSLRGQTISNAFFWAISRSQDATVMHDWYSRTGQSVGGEYRYNLGAGSEGIVETRLLDESIPNGAGVTQDLRSYEIRGNASQRLPRGFRARADVNYFSSLTSVQSSNANINQATNGRRVAGANVVGSWRTFSLNGTVRREEQFTNLTDSIVRGSGPRLVVTQNERPLYRGSPFYISFSSEYARIIAQQLTTDVSIDSSVTRLDLSPRIRYPFKRWQWLTVTTALSWRDTFYTRSIDLDHEDPETGRPAIVDRSLNRHYFTMQADLVGPVFNRIWDTPNSGYSERIKHTIEPVLNISRTSSINEFDRVLVSDGTDYVVGDATRWTYGINNRIYARRRLGPASQAREIISVSLSQTYSTDARDSQRNQDYVTGIGGAPSRFTPVSLSVRATPADHWQATFRAEVDSKHRELRSLTISGSYNLTQFVQATANWNQRFFIENEPGFDDPGLVRRNLSLTAGAQTHENRLGGRYEISYDARNANVIQQKMTAFYNAQCCGIAMEYQTFNLGGLNVSGVQTDRRFFLSFTLAGLGNFSPLSGAMANVPR